MGIENTFRNSLNLLRQVAFRCNEINDPRLNELMLRLNLYEMSNVDKVKMIRQMIKEQKNDYYSINM